MNPEDIAVLKKAAAGLEASLDTLETWLESGNGRSLYLASLSILIAMRHIYDADPQLLNAVNRKRVEAVMLKEKDVVKESRFQTGF